MKQWQFKRAADAYLAWCWAHETTPQVNELASWLGITAAALSHAFLAAVGVRPSAYLKKEQVREAMRLIKTTRLNFATIASKTGFGSRTILFRAIRRITGRTPESFRR